MGARKLVCHWAEGLRNSAVLFANHATAEGGSIRQVSPAVTQLAWPIMLRRKPTGSQ